MPELKDITGQRFGRLVVIEYNRYSRLWKCQCDCGKMKMVRRSSLINGNTKSCGCLVKEGPPVRKDLTGKRYGMLTVISYDVEKKKWLCQCDCGKQSYVLRCNLQNGNTKSCGCQKYKGLPKLVDLTGKRFDHLTVLQRAPSSIDANGLAQTRWFCKCDCGAVIVAMSKNLKQPRHHACNQCLYAMRKPRGKAKPKYSQVV